MTIPLSAQAAAYSATREPFPKTTEAPPSCGATTERNGGARWYVVQTQQRAEMRASAQLRAQKFEVFLPRIRRTVRHARQMRTALVPAFPGYLFVRVDIAAQRWRSINGTIGVTRLIMAHEQPLPIPRGVVETLLDYVDAAGVARFDRDLAAGQRVRIKDGPLADSIGRLVRFDANDRVRVLLDIMAGQVETSLDRSSLEAA